MFLQTNGEQLEQTMMLLKALGTQSREGVLFTQNCQISLTFYGYGSIAIVSILAASRQCGNQS
jgi:hypothetical protein